MDNIDNLWYHIELKVLGKVPHHCYLPYSETGGLQGYALFFLFTLINAMKLYFFIILSD